MNELEQRVRSSLQQRGEDAVPTPALWQAVDGRLRRRRRRLVVSWSLAAAAAVLAAFAVVPGLVDLVAPPAVPDVADQPGSSDAGQDATTPEDDATTPEDDVTTPDDDVTAPEDDVAAPGEGAGAADDRLDPAPDATSVDGLVQVVEGRTLQVVDGAEVRSQLTLPAEGESVITEVAVRPGSSVDDLEAVVVTTAEGFWDLRVLRVRDGEIGLELFPERFAPRVETGAGGWIGAPMWAPDGRHLAWVETTGSDWTLQTIGWADGPGTGRTSDDNAGFGLSLEPSAEVTAARWTGWSSADEPAGPTTGTLVIEVAAGPDVEVAIERQADGALALPGGDVTGR